MRHADRGTPTGVDYGSGMTPTPLPPDPLAAVERDLQTLGTVPLDEQAAVFEGMHRTVTQVLAETAPKPESDPAPAAR